MARKSSKTAHVMKLLAGEESETSTIHPPIPVVDMASASDPIGELIRIQLEEKEEEEAPISKSDDIKEPEGIAEIEDVDVQETESLPYEYVNVMETIVKKQVGEYINKLDSCTCDHCLASITAYALTNLPPKYIVADKAEIPPMLSFYENHYASQLVIELVKACNAIREMGCVSQKN